MCASLLGLAADDGAAAVLGPAAVKSWLSVYNWALL